MRSIHTLLVRVFLLTAIALAGCADESQSGVPGVNTCTPACAAGQVCVGNTCVSNPPPANPDAPVEPSNGCVPPCPAGQMCSGDRCVPRPPTSGCDPPCIGNRVCRNNVCVANNTPMGGRPVGGECARAADCADGVCFNPNRFPGGYCSKSCGSELVTQGDACPAESACFQIGESAAFCLDTCQGNMDCRTDYVCATAASGERKACIPRCKSNDDCDVGYPCNTTSGLCEAAAAPTGRPVGAPCAAAAECASSVCLTAQASMNVFPGGYCIAQCTAAEENKPCANGKGLCAGITDDQGVRDYYCFGACTTGADCRPEYMCSADAMVLSAGGTGVCIPRCERYSCEVGETCDTSVGICTAGGPMPTPSGVVHTPLGTLTGLARPEADWKSVSVVVPAGATSFSLVGKASDPTAIPGVAKITAPNGRVIYDATDPSLADFMIFDGDWPAGQMAILFPNAPRLNLLPGKYDILLGATAPTNVKVDVLVKSQSGVPQGGKLPLVFWFTQNQYLNAERAKTDTSFQQVIAEFDEMFAAAGIKIGPFTYADVPGDLGKTSAVISEFEDLDALFAHANSSSEKALHFFMIEQFNFGGGGGVLGISGGIPGPPAFPGLPHGGVAVALAYIKNIDGVAETMAHEAGHFLGLFHSSERGGTSHDPLLDTPECTTAEDANRDGRLDVEECLAKDADNLMFWGSKTGFQQRKVTNDQRFVLFRNPSVQ